MASELPTSNSCQRFIKDIMGHWTAEEGYGHMPHMKFRFGADFSVTRVPVKTSIDFVHTTFVSWPYGKKETEGMHYENGFMRCVGNTLEYNIAHHKGLSEIVKGTVVEDPVKGTRTATLYDTFIGNSEYLTKVKRVMEVNAATGIFDDDCYIATNLNGPEKANELHDHLKMTYKRQ